MNKPGLTIAFRPRPTLLAVLTALLYILCAMALGAEEADDAPRPRDFLPLLESSLADLAGRFTKTELALLASEGAMFKPWDAKPLTSLLPLPSRKAGLENELVSIAPTLGNEVLLIYPLPASLRGQSPSQQQLALFNLAHRFSTMEGLQYWSRSKQQMATFFTYSRFVGGPNDRKARPDPVFTTLPGTTTEWVQQQDSKFGNNLYRLSYRAIGNNAVELRMQNHEQMWYGIAPVLSPYAVDLHLIVSLHEDVICFYGNVGINAIRILGLDEQARASYLNRMIALFSWFTGQVGKP